MTRAPASPPVQDAGELVGRLKARSETAVERILRHLAILAERGSEIDCLNFRNENGEWVSASVAIEGAAAEIERLTAERDGKEPWAANVRLNAENAALLARAAKAEADLAEARAALVDPDMPAQQLRLHMGELTASEARVARAAIRWANTRLTPEPQP